MAAPTASLLRDPQFETSFEVWAPTPSDAHAALPIPLRQLLVTDLGHEEPTILLTNQLRRSAATLIQRYAQRMLVENELLDESNPELFAGLPPNAAQ